MSDADHPDRLAACAGKKPYSSKAAAMAVGRRMHRRGKTTPRPFKCAHCRQWHLAHDTERRW